jgi:hypothetical protein
VVQELLERFRERQRGVVLARQIKVQLELAYG